MPWKQWEGRVVDGQFRLGQYLGGSDRSAVFLTERDGLKAQKNAIKLILEGPENAELRLARWRQVAQLRHPHLLQLFQSGRCELDGTKLLYVVMEYADEELSQILPERSLTPAEARDMLQSVLGALSFVHSKGFVHSHVKPSNVMAIADQLKISSDQLCVAGEHRRDPGKRSSYDAPEAGIGVVSPAQDVWALGMTLVEALTQSLPIWEPTNGKELILPKTLPAPFRDIATNCLRPDPQRRWTVHKLAASLQGASPVWQTQVDRKREKSLGIKRYMFPAMVAALVLLAIMAGARLRNHRREAQPPESLPITSDQPQNSGAAASAPSSSPATPAATDAPVRGAVSHQVLPQVSEGARNTIQGKVRVRVRINVDPSGNVTAASFDSPGPSKYFARLALQASQDWKFKPPEANGQPVASEWMLRFAFGRTATEAVPTQLSP